MRFGSGVLCLRLEQDTIMAEQRTKGVCSCCEHGGHYCEQKLNQIWSIYLIIFLLKSC